MPVPDAARDPVLTVPEVVFPDQRIDHRDVVEIVREQYRELCSRYPGDPDYRREFVKEVELALRMSSRLGIDSHPVHLPVEELTRPRGLRARNDQAREAFRQYVPAAAAGALARAGVAARDVDAVLVETSTVLAMPSLAVDAIELLGLRSDAEVIPYTFLGCNGGGHAIARGRDYLLAHPGHILLVIAADYASPHFFVEEDLRGGQLRGSVISSALFADATAAAVMASDLDVPGFRIVRTASVSVPGTREALSWEVADDGLHFRLTDLAMRLVPDVAKGLNELMGSQGWSADDLAVCSFHTGGDRIIKNIADALGLSAHQVQPTREALRSGNTMAAATLDALRIIGTREEFRPPHGAPGMGAGFGPGFSSTAYLWTFHDPGAAA
jgi:predicted naringenin-chalcone synthase